MKLQSLAIIFIIIVMPMTLVLNEYMNNKITIAETELQYNNKVLNSTYDAIKAFQLNTVNNSFGDISDEKLEDIEAAANTCLSSLATNFGYSGYKSTVMQEYVPAIAFTLYDGYYIYSPYTNVITEKSDADVSDEYKNGTSQVGLKPYIYYSCRYISSNYDFVITYTLDNYITIQGTVNGSYVYDYGYLYNIDNADGIKKLGENYIYDTITFSKDDTEELKEYVGSTEYPYVKINGKKYYYDDKGNSDESDDGIFYIDKGGSKNYNQVRNTDADFAKYKSAIFNNKSAYEYYKEAYEFSDRVFNTYKLNNIKTSNAYIYNNAADGSTSIQEYGDFQIFNNMENILDSSSKFNQHRRSIIRYVVETNLLTSITSFSANSSNNTEYTMPKISEDDWEIIEENVSAITFVQGLKMGAKKYNGYAVVANTLTKECVREDDIYLLTEDTNGTNYYCTVDDKEIGNSLNLRTKAGLGYYPGVWKINFEYTKIVKESDKTNIYYFPTQYLNSSGETKTCLGSYTSIMGTSGRQNTGTSTLAYIKSSANTTLKEIYYKALGRERYGAFNVNNINYDMNNKSNNLYYFLDEY